MRNPTLKPQQNSEDPQQDDHEVTFTCEICIEPFTLRDKFKNNDCADHPFCNDCMIKYIQMKLEENTFDVRCPATTCDHSLDPFSCRPMITHQLFDKWCDVLCESTVLGVQRVYCPNRECSELILNECGARNLKRCVCPHCKKSFCFRCRVPWHDGSTCGETRDENDFAFDALRKKKKWQTCPKCFKCVQHGGGSNRITCRCETKFCYMCGKQYCYHGQGLLWLARAVVFIFVIICASSYLI